MGLHHPRISWLFWQNTKYKMKIVLKFVYLNMKYQHWKTKQKTKKKYHSLLDYLPSKWGAKFQSTNMLIDKCQISLWLKIDVSIVRLEPGDKSMNFIMRRIVKSCYMIRCIMYALWLVLDVTTNNSFRGEMHRWSHYLQHFGFWRKNKLIPYCCGSVQL